MAVLNLPEGFRRVAAADVPVGEASEFVRTVFMAESGRPFLSEQNLATFRAAPFIDEESDFACVRDAAGRLAGLAVVWSRPPHVDPGCFAAVAPRHYDRGLGSALLAWQEARAREQSTAAPAGAAVAMLALIDAHHERSVQLLTEHGFTPDRFFITMEIDFDEPPPAPVFPPGLELREFTEDQLVAGAAAQVDAFRDHYGFVERPLEERLVDLRHTISRPDFDPSLWWHLYEGDEAVANLWCSGDHEGDRTVGYVGSLGVRKAWRGRGLGRNLLLHAFGEFYRRGRRGAALDVDAQSLTGATGLYESVGMTETYRNAAYAKELRPGRDFAVRAL